VALHQSVFVWLTCIRCSYHGWLVNRLKVFIEVLLSFDSHPWQDYLDSGLEEGRQLLSLKQVVELYPYSRRGKAGRRCFCDAQMDDKS
jgi:hypothetical protein